MRADHHSTSAILPRPSRPCWHRGASTDRPRDWFDHLWRQFAYTPLANLCGIPAISLPLAEQENGLPLGIQAQAAQAQDGTLLQLAAQIERAIAGMWNAGRRPGVHVTAD